MATDGYWAVFGYGVSATVWSVVMLALLQYPGDVPTRRVDWQFLAVAWFIVTGIGSGMAFISKPEWNGLSATAQWPTLSANRSLFDAVGFIYAVGCLGCAAGIVVLLRQRLQLSSGIERRALGPAIVGVTIAGLIAATASAFETLWPTPQVWAQGITLQGLGLLTAPLSVVVVLLNLRRIASDVLAALPNAATPAAVEAALASVLGDHSIAVYFHSREDGSYIDSVGQRVNPYDQGGDRLLVPLHKHVVAASPNEQDAWCMISLSSNLRQHRHELEAALAAARMSLENARLQAELQAQLLETQMSRLAIVKAREAGRRDLARDLHDGAQVTLLSIPLGLEVLRHRVGDPQLDPVFQALKARIKSAAAQIHDLAEGLESVLLREKGLRPAAEAVVSSLHGSLPASVHINIPDARYPTELETAAYFVITEALANVVKHARATTVTIQCVHRAGTLEVAVSDDGIGGADSTSRGLRGIADRVAILDGNFTVHSPLRQGTTVHAALPANGATPPG